MSLAGRPPVGLGVTSGGNFYGNTQITFTDVLGDKQISFFAQSVSQYRTIGVHVREHRAPAAVRAAGLLAGHVLLRPGPRTLYDPSPSRVSSIRDLAEAVQSQRGGTAFAIWPFNRYARAEFFGGYMHLSRAVHRIQLLQELVDQYQVDQYGQPALPQRPHDAARRLVRAGNDGLPRVRPGRRQHVQGLARRLARLWRTAGCRARRSTPTPATTRGWPPTACSPCASRASRAGAAIRTSFYFGGNSEMRGYDYLQFIGHKAFFANAELRFPLIEAMLTPLGVLGGLRGVFFVNIGGAGFNRPVASSSWRNESTSSTRRSLGYELVDIFGTVVAGLRRLRSIAACGWSTARASYGIGLESSCSASRCTSTGRGRRCSTATGKTRSSPAGQPTASAAARSAR